MFSVGDIIGYCGQEYKVVSVSINGERVSVDSVRTGRNQGMNPASLFTLVTPARPKLTGMTQFFKDIKEKQHEASI